MAPGKPVNRQIVLTMLTFHDGLDFVDRALERAPVTQRLLFLPAPLGALCLFNGLNPEEILASEDLSCELICTWYVAHREAGGEPDPVADEILFEVIADDAVVDSILLTYVPQTNETPVRSPPGWLGQVGTRNRVWKLAGRHVCSEYVNLPV